MPTKHLIHLFWQRVFSTPEAPSMLVASTKKSDRRALTITWQKTGEAVAAIMTRLTAFGVRKGDRVALLGWNSPEWVWADLAIQSLGAVAVPIYPNNSQDQVRDILIDSGARVAVSSDPAQINVIPEDEPENKAPLLFLLLKNEDDSKLPFHHFFVDGVQHRINPFHGVTEMLNWMSAHSRSASFMDLKDDDLATIIYTSGSTGVPKGCMISHGNIAGVLEALDRLGFKRSAERDRYLSYLPLAHVYERFNGMAVALRDGVPVSFCAIDKVRDFIGIYQPTMLCGVPAVWRKIRDGVYMPQDQPLKLLDRMGAWKPLLDWAVTRKKGSWQHAIADRLILAKIRAKLGGRLKLLVSGGAPISKELLGFYHALGLALLEGYGLTETTGGVAITPEGEQVPEGSCGRLLPGVEARIIYEDGETEFGEIQLRGKQIFKGYWRKPAETADVFTDDGWFKTGDLGRMILGPDGKSWLVVIGRANGMYKTEGGKFVPKEKVEKAFESFSVVQYVVPVAHGRKYATALIFVNQQVASKLIGDAIPQGLDRAAYLAQKDPVLDAIKAAVEGANAKLERWEQVKRYKVMPLEATVGNGLLTPTQKMRTKEAFTRFAADIEALYKQPAE